MSNELAEIVVMIVLTLIILLGIFLLVYLSDKKAKRELEKESLSK